MKKIILIFALISQFSHATKFKAIEMPERVQMADFIMVGKIQNMMCLGADGERVEPGQKCTGPGSSNRLMYEITPTQVLFYKPPIGSAKNNNPPRFVSFSFTGLSHTSVPKDDFASEKDRELIFFLRLSANGGYLPIHEGFFATDASSKTEVQALVRKLKR